MIPCLCQWSNSRGRHTPMWIQSAGPPCSLTFQVGDIYNQGTLVLNIPPPHENTSEALPHSGHCRGGTKGVPKPIPKPTSLPSFPTDEHGGRVGVAAEPGSLFKALVGNREALGFFLVFKSCFRFCEAPRTFFWVSGMFPIPGVGRCFHQFKHRTHAPGAARCCASTPRRTSTWRPRARPPGVSRRRCTDTVWW